MTCTGDRATCPIFPVYKTAQAITDRARAALLQRFGVDFYRGNHLDPTRPLRREVLDADAEERRLAATCTCAAKEMRFARAVSAGNWWNTHKDEFEARVEARLAATLGPSKWEPLPADYKPTRGWWANPETKRWEWVGQPPCNRIFDTGEPCRRCACDCYDPDWTPEKEAAKWKPPIRCQRNR